MVIRRFVAKGGVEKLGDRKYRIPMSDESLDRHRTVIKSDGWMFENFLRNPVISHQHETFSNDPDSIVGKGLEVNIKNSISYLDFELEPEGDNPRADKLAKKLDFGSIRALSVGFNPLEWSKGDRSLGEDPEVIYFRKQDLLEVSIVHIPSNPNATPSRNIEAELEEFVRIIREEETPLQKETTPEAKGMDEHRSRLLRLRLNTLKTF